MHWSWIFIALSTNDDKLQKNETLKLHTPNVKICLWSLPMHTEQYWFLNGSLKALWFHHLLKNHFFIWNTFIGSLKYYLRFFKEPWFERFFVEPEMVLLWRHSEEPYSVRDGVAAGNAACSPPDSGTRWQGCARLFPYVAHIPSDLWNDMSSFIIHTR